MPMMALAHGDGSWTQLKAALADAARHVGR